MEYYEPDHSTLFPSGKTCVYSTSRFEVDIPYFPQALRILFKSLSMFDPDFARAFVDGRFYEGLDHTETLKRVQCPTLIMHANWFRHPDYGLFGALDADDAESIQELVPQAEYIQIPANHVIH